MDEPIIALMIPIVAIIFGAILGAVSMFYKSKQLAMLHEERKHAMDRGLPVPPNLVLGKSNPVSAHKGASIANRKAFVILFMIGLGFLVFFPELDHDDPGGKFFGGILILLSFAFLIISFFKYKLSPEEKELFEQHRDYGKSLSPSETENE